ncbi:MAG: hypothetical protein GVY14_10750 [Spirochaetes bacterium]|jgi:signal transduction histidine kinase|nr:hypothetical protein [Spirochaetota bacterium]
MNQAATNRPKTSTGFRQLPLFLVVILVLGLSLPLVQSYGALSRIADEVEALRNFWFSASIDAMQRLLVEPQPTHEMANAYEPLEEMLASPIFTELERFPPELRTAMTSLSEAVGRSLPASREMEPEHWLDRMEDINSRFLAVQDVIGDIALQRERTYRSVGVFALFLVVGISILYGQQVREVRALAGERAVKNRMAQLAAKVQEDERRSLARELHDGTAQRLAIARMEVDHVADPRTKKMLQESLTQAIDEVRLIAYNMRPIGISPNKPAEMIRELALFFEDRYPLRFELLLRSELTVTWGQEDLIHLYRIAQEALANVVRHAQADKVRVELQYTPEGLVALRVADNGTGLGDTPEGLGRNGMRERAELIGGTIRWRSENGQGTVVELLVSPDRRRRKGVEA